VLDLYSGRTILDKTIKTQGRDTYGGIYSIVDRATALALNMSPIRIENANGDFVAPTPESMSAALPLMERTTDGRLMPVPAMTASSGEQPYPMTFVVYAIAPKAALVDMACVPRATSQKLLADWLTYLTTEGQASLGQGLEPLPPALQAEAATAIAQIGTGSPGCTPPAVLGAAGSASIAPLLPTPTAVAAYRSTAPSASATVIPQAVVDAELAAVAAELPEFVRASSTTTTGSLIGLLIVFALLVIAAMATAGSTGLPDRLRKIVGAGK
jgi:hypothetical protein